MKTITFTENTYGYSASLPGDLTGEYVRADVARELLATCKELLAGIDSIADCIDHVDCSADGGDRYYAACRAAEEAITNAEGGKSHEANSNRLLTAAMRFVPKPEDMAGFDDEAAPDEVREMVELAKWLHEQAEGGK